MNQKEFIRSSGQAIDDGSFVKISLGNYKGPEQGLNKIIVRQAIIKKTPHLSFTYRYNNKDIVKNYKNEEGLNRVAGYLDGGFNSATLFTVNYNLVLDHAHKKSKLRKEKPTVTAKPSKDHDRQKKRLIAPDAKSYLQALKITDREGNVYKNAQDKFRQINRYVEVLAPFLKDYKEGRTISVADMGAGKGYLTFALYDYLANQKKVAADIVGVEYRDDLVSLCNGIAQEAGFDGLRFVQGSIESYHADHINMLIALHACDTATDDALYKGIKANADTIVVAPCCHKQVRREMEAAKASGHHHDLEAMTRHGIFLERHAEMITDSLRALILEYYGYNVRVFEFISNEHTAKNIMIIGTKHRKADADRDDVLLKINNLQEKFSVKHHYLRHLCDF